MVVVESSMAGGRKEVALAAIALLSAVLQAHGSITDIVSPAMWSRVVRAVGVGVEAATSPACMVPLLVSAAAPGAACSAVAAPSSAPVAVCEWLAALLPPPLHRQAAVDLALSRCHHRHCRCGSGCRCRWERRGRGAQATCE